MLSPKIRKMILERQHGECFYCGELLIGGIVHDHLVPRSHRGSHTHENRVASCDFCDRIKGNRAPFDVELNMQKRLIEEYEVQESVDRAVIHVDRIS